MTHLLPRDRRAWLLAAAFLGLAALYIVFCGSAEIYDLRGDASTYLLMAKFFSPFEAANPMLQAFSREYISPPLFPLLIAMLGATPLAGNIVVIGSLLGSFGVLFLWLLREGVERTRAFVVVLIVALAPLTYLSALNIWSENPYLLFSLIAIYAVARAENTEGDAPTQRHWWLAALAVAAATLTRVAALPLLAAFGIYLLLRRPRAYWRTGLLALAPFLAWVIIARLKQTGLSGYTGQWSALYAANMGEVLLRTSSQWLAASAAVWRDGLLGDGAGAVLAAIAGLIGFIAVAAWLERLYRMRFDAIYVTCYAAMLFAWPHAEEAGRYAYVIVPLLLAYPVLLLQRIGGMSAMPPQWRRRIPVVAGILLGINLLIMVPGLLVNAERFFRPVPAEFKANRKLDSWYTADRYSTEVLTPTYVKIVQSLPALADKIAPGECIFAIKPNMVMLHTGHLSMAPPKSDASDAEFAAGITKCRYAFIINLYSTSFREAYYPLGRLGKGAKVIVPIKLGEGADSTLIGALIEINPK